MSIFICLVCKQLHGTKAEKKNCNHQPIEVKKPKKAKKETLITEKVSHDEAKKLLGSLATLDADGVKSLAFFLDIEYTNKEETVTAIKIKTGR